MHILIRGIVLAILFVLVSVQGVFAADYGLTDTVRSSGLPTNQGGLAVMIGTVLGNLLSMIGVLFFVLMIYGGFLWMTARGNEDQTAKAFNTIIAAAVGLMIVMAAYAITSTVFTSVVPGSG